MPSRIATPVLTVDAGKMHKIDTRNVENLFGMWTVFSKCAESMEEGRRLENLSWRIWNRETFCCESQPLLATTPAIDMKRPRPSSKDIPDLSASVDSISSVEEEGREQRSSTQQSAPLEIRRPPTHRIEVSGSCGRGKEKHITSLGLEKMVISIKEKKDIEPLSPTIADAVPTRFPSTSITPRPLSPVAQAPHQSSDSSSSSMPLSSPESESRRNMGGSDTSAELMTSHSVVRGFSPSHISSSYRSHTHLAPAPVPVKAPSHTKPDDGSKKGGFMLGGSSGEDESSFEERMSSQVAHSSSLSAGLKRPLSEKKTTSFKDEVESRTINPRAHHDDDAVFDSDDEEDVSESAIEDEDDSEDWEDSASESSDSDHNEKSTLFQRVDSRPNLTSRRSLLTTMIHQPDRAAAVLAMASKSSPALQRSRTSSPNGPSLGATPADQPSFLTQETSITQSKPIIMTTSNIHPPALSPRTTRRNMLATELTVSLRNHLLHERQQKNTTANAVLKRRHTAHDMANLEKFPSAPGSSDASKTNSWNHYFDHGLGEYHEKGW